MKRSSIIKDFLSSVTLVTMKNRLLTPTSDTFLNCIAGFYGNGGQTVTHGRTRGSLRSTLL